MYLLDTNICIYIINHKPQSVLNKFKQVSPDELGISSITVAELEYGVAKSKFMDRNKTALELFLAPFEIFNFDTIAAHYYGGIRSHLEKLGKPIGAMDLLIASHTMALNRTIVTNNSKEFIRIPNLKVENWM